MAEVRRLDSSAPDFAAALARLTAVNTALDEAIDTSVANIIVDVRARGDAAVLEYTAMFDRIKAPTMASLELGPVAFEAAFESLCAEQRDALVAAAERVRTYHRHQRVKSWSFTEADGTRLGQQVTALERVGIYVPGGKAAYPSSVLMNALPAQVAGVHEIVMVVPTPNGVRSPLVLAAAHVAGVTRAFTIGGAQAIAALAYGTATIPAVDKIVGPGNAYVAAAKRRVFGVVGIDMIAGPSEIIVIADGSAHPDWIAMDLFSQAEHDEAARAILLSPEPELIDAVAESMARQLPTMARKEIIAASLASRGALVRVRDLAEACAISNDIAPEHLELAVAEPELLVARIRNAGAIFVGHFSSEALGDYCAGPNHVLPTARSARFSSPLGVYDFQKRTSVVAVSRQGAQTLGRLASTLARGEGLPAHAASAEYRLDK
jgi:histidinol dehydrogenase